MIVLGFSVGALAASVVLVIQLRSLEADREAGRRTLVGLLGTTATRVAYSLLVVVAFVVLIIAWGIGEIPTPALAPFLTAPLAIRLGDIVSHHAGRELEDAQREAIVFALAFLLLLALGLTVPVGGS